MATRTAIAAKERALKEKIADKDRAENKRQFEKGYKLKEFEANSKHLMQSAKATKDIVGAAGGMSALMNEPQWYKNFNLSAYSVKLPTFYRLGSQLVDRWLDDTTYDVVPGIATLVYCPTLPNQNYTNVAGSKYYQTSPINQSLTRFMAELRKLNSRIGDYDPSDIGLYLYALIGIMIQIGELQKAIKGYNTYYAENSYLSRGFIKSCGFDPDDFNAHVPEYKAQLIKWISIFNANAVLPATLDLLKRYAWMSTIVIREHNNSNSQLYHFRCAYNMYMNEDEEYIAFSRFASLHTFTAYVNNMNTKIQRLFNSVGVVTMTADLRAAFPDNQCVKWPEFKGDETLNYSESVHDLEQVHNARTLPSAAVFVPQGDSTFNPDLLNRTNIVVDNDGYLAQGAFSSGNLLPLVYTFQYTNDQLDLLSVGTISDNQFLNFYDSDMISDDSILEASRFRYSMFQYNSTWNGHAFRECGTELIITVELTLKDALSDTPVIMDVFSDYYTSNYGLTTAELFATGKASTFDWFPWIRYVYRDDSAPINTIGEIDHAVYISNDNLRIIHEGCAFSLFYTDSFAKGRVA